MKKPVTVHYLEMTSPSDQRPARDPDAALEIHRVEIPAPELNRFFYTTVGGPWYWIDRLSWSRARWMEWLSRAEVETWIASRNGIPAGYFELERQAGGDVELAYFGLIPQFVGAGMGGALLSAAIRRAWAMGAGRVWLHTCSLDHPRALQVYEKHGFRRFKEETVEQEVPEEPPGPWPGWDGGAGEGSP